MKTTIKELIFTLFPAYNELVQLQKMALVQIPSKANFNFIRDYSKLSAIHKKFEKFKLEKLDAIVKKDEHGNFKTILKNEVSVYDFMNDGDENAFNIELNKYIDQEAEWNPLKTSIEDIKETHNFPIGVYQVFEAFEMFTELNLSSGIKIVK